MIVQELQPACRISKPFNWLETTFQSLSSLCRATPCGSYPVMSSSICSSKESSVCNSPGSRLHSQGSHLSSNRKWWCSVDCAKLRAAIISWSRQPIVIVRIRSSEPLRNECQWLFDSHSNWKIFARPMYRQYRGATLLLHTLAEAIERFLGSKIVKTKN